MAEDVVVVLDVVGERSAHVYGILFGSFVVQEFVLCYFECVQVFVFGSSSVGGFVVYKFLFLLFVQIFLICVGVMGFEEVEWVVVFYMYVEKMCCEHFEWIVFDIAHCFSTLFESLVYMH